MTTIFTLNNINFKHNGTETKEPNRFYKEVDGKNIRISADAYDEALGLWLKQEQENAKIEEAKQAMESDLAAEQAFNKVEDDHLAEVGKQIAEQAKAKAKKAKAKKKRKSKDVAYRMVDEATGETRLTLTAKQVDFLHEASKTLAWEGFDHPTCIDMMVDEIGGQFAGKPMTVGAMISTLREKGLITVGIETVNGRKAKIMGLTILGEAVAKVILEVK